MGGVVRERSSREPLDSEDLVVPRQQRVAQVHLVGIHYIHCIYIGDVYGVHSIPYKRHMHINILHF